MSKQAKILIGILLSFSLVSLCYGSDTFGKDSFPEIEGLVFDGNTEIYYPDSLFEYIDGAADQFLEYEFETLFSKNYKGSDGKAVTVDVYRHKDVTNAFGIYSQEKPDKGNFVDTGTQGYYEEGILNFFSGRFYVKISSFDLGEKEREIIFNIAKRISDKLKAENKFPEELKFFPKDGKIPNSEKYVSKNFLGYSFFNSVFTCKYRLKNGITEMFLLSSKSEDNAKQIIDKYSNYLKKKGVKTLEAKAGFIFSDPNYKREGKICLKNINGYIAGIFCKESPDFTLLNKISGNIDKNVSEQIK